MTASARRAIRKVTLVDDDQDARAELAKELKYAGYEPSFPKKRRYHEPAELIAEIIDSRVEGVICDHRLSDGNYADFEGATFVADLYDNRIPAILLTDWAKEDSYGPIRRYRPRICSLIKTGEADPETIDRGFELCVREFSGERVPERRAVRTIVVVEGTLNINSETIVEAFVPAWRPHDPVRFPLGLIEEKWHAEVKRGKCFSTWSNIAAENQEDLFFERFMPAPDPGEALANG